jgi:pimeloyl-ACP methyl ester carboxylesterase
VTLARVRRRLLQVSAVAVFIILAGATYQGVATAFERRQFPHPGQLADVGGHQLHLYCTGEGSPTVVLEAPAAGMSAAWGWVQPEVAKATRTCSYDRAGLGWSEAGDGGFDPATVPGQLQALLTRASVRPPFVVAGQGFGAALARLDAQRLGNDVVALVLVDPPSDGSSRPPADDDGAARLMAVSPWLARAGVLRATGMLSASAEGLPGPAAGALTAFLNRPDHLTRSGRELARWDDVVAQSREAALRPDLKTTEVKASGAARVAFLTDPRVAAAVTRSILEAVASARKR